ncbi:MAG: hypothetical protein D6702_01855 [Planctomycetota bacterium]|nr:MAG: hypothetical protein D6702_01855 [Planctomycetota bacterium]
MTGATAGAKSVLQTSLGEIYDMTITPAVHGAVAADGNWLAGVVTATAEGDLAANGMITLN